MKQLRPPIDRHDHLHGDLSAPVMLVEFGDYQCPFCGRAYYILKELEEAMGARLCLAFRNFPLVGAHPQARLAAAAAEAAALQGRFWEMHDVLYEHQRALHDTDLEGYAAALGLDMKRFRADMRSQAVDDRIRADLHSGAVSGVNGTPTFFINGSRYDGDYDLDSLLEAVGASELRIV